MSVDAAWDSAALAGKVCDALVESGKLREKPAFIRGDREKLLAKIFGTAKLDGAALAGMSGRQVEVAVRNATQGEAWVDDVQNALKGMLSEEAKNSTEGAGESAEMKALREKMVEQAKTGNPWTASRRRRQLRRRPRQQCRRSSFDSGCSRRARR